ncbi:MAG: hypothetical protein WAV89_01885 [Ignavibacteriaceae bacterium]
MILFPIILFVYNRPEHTKKTVEALQLNQFAEESVLHIFSDGNKNENDKKSVEEVRDYISTINGFKEIKIILRDRTLGLANSVISGVTEVINEYGKAIVLEDDIVTSPYFLKFMNEALDFYEKDKKIYSISGYSFPIKIPKSYPHQVYISSRASSWGWATWQDRWRRADWNPEKSFNVYDKKELRNIMDRAGKDLAPMLLKSIEGKIDSWAVKVAFTQLKNNSYCLFPVHSLVKNIGADASGTNFVKSTKKYEVEFFSINEKIEFANDLIVDLEIQKQVQKIVRPGIISYLKYCLFNIY